MLRAHFIWTILVVLTSISASAQQPVAVRESLLYRHTTGFLNSQRHAYQGTEIEINAKIETDIDKVMDAVRAYGVTHPGLNLSVCKFQFRNKFAYHFNGKLSLMQVEQQQRMQSAIDASIDPESIALFAGYAKPIIHPDKRPALEQINEEESYESFKRYWSGMIEVVREAQNEVTKVRVATRRFSRWKVARTELERFISQDLKVPLDKVEWLDRSTLSGMGTNFFELNNTPIEDPVVDLNIAFAVLNFDCSGTSDYAELNNIQLAISGVSVEPGKGGNRTVLANFTELPKLLPNWRAGVMFDELFKAFEDLVNDEFLDLFDEITSKTHCGITLDVALRKVEMELQNNEPSFSTHVYLRTGFVVQGWDDPAVYRIYHNYPVEGGNFRDLRAGQRGIADGEVYMRQLRSILKKETAAKTLCTRPTRAPVDVN